LPAPTGGTITFTDNGTTIPGCGGVSLSGGRALCHVQHGAQGAHRIIATYNPGAGFVDSTSNTTGQMAVSWIVAG
jgi:hypothetical protein